MADFKPGQAWIVKPVEPLWNTHIKPGQKWHAASPLERIRVALHGIGYRTQEDAEELVRDVRHVVERYTKLLETHDWLTAEYNRLRACSLGDVLPDAPANGGDVDGGAV
jgi:hypothetical protein